METTPPWDAKKRISREEPALVWQSSQSVRFMETLMHGVGEWRILVDVSGVFFF